MDITGDGKEMNNYVIVCIDTSFYRTYESVWVVSAFVP
jgi:hypothetical protein